MSEFMEVELNKDKNHFKKIRLKNHNWEVLVANKNLLFDALEKLLFDKVNIFYYLTQRVSTKTMKDTKAHVRNLIKNGILNGEIKSVFLNMGWAGKKIDITSTVFQGDLAEYLMSIFMDDLNISETLISKVSIKTNPNMPAYGNDNVYFDYNTKILYFGESKFYSNLEDGIKKSYESISKHNNITEISFLKNHTGIFISESSKKLKKVQQKFETMKVDDFKVASICFVAQDELYLKDDIDKVLSDKKLNTKINETMEKNNILVILPVLSKEEFLKHFRDNIDNYI